MAILALHQVKMEHTKNSSQSQSKQQTSVPGVPNRSPKVTGWFLFSILKHCHEPWNGYRPHLSPSQQEAGRPWNPVATAACSRNCVRHVVTPADQHHKSAAKSLDLHLNGNVAEGGKKSGTLSFTKNLWLGRPLLLVSLSMSFWTINCGWWLGYPLLAPFTQLIKFDFQWLPIAIFCI